MSIFTTDLIVKYTLQAGHSLDTREELHDHLWKFEMTFTGDPKNGRIIDLPLLEKTVGAIFDPFQKTNLNGNSRLTPAGAAFPTCETLGESFFLLLEAGALDPLRREVNKTIRLVSVKVTLCELDGKTYGSAIVRKR